MEIPSKPDAKPLSLTLGCFSFTPDVDDIIDQLREEIQELKNRIANLERKQDRLPWWRRLAS